MPLRRFVVPALLLLLAACSSQETQRPSAPFTFEEPPQATSVLHELHGSLIGVPANSEVELALLEVNRRDQPDIAVAACRPNAFLLSCHDHRRTGQAGGVIQLATKMAKARR